MVIIEKDEVIFYLMFVFSTIYVIFSGDYVLENYPLIIFLFILNIWIQKLNRLLQLTVLKIKIKENEKKTKIRI